MAHTSRRACTLPLHNVGGLSDDGRVTKWHPIEQLREPSPGLWVMPDPVGEEYGRVELRRVNDGELRYKVTFQGELLGWAGSLRYGAERLHARYLASL